MNSPRTVLTIATLMLAVLVTSPQLAFAWGRDGHKIICAIAEAKLNPAALTFIKKISEQSEHLDGKANISFPTSCLWADSARFGKYLGSYESHFINIAEDQSSLDVARDCAALDCIAVGIQRSIVYLSSEAGSKREQARQAAALRFLGHFIGDMHQPMHVSNAEDWGGNKIAVQWFGKRSNLHKVWDSGIMQQANLSYPTSLNYLMPNEAAGVDVNIEAWLNESFQLARQNGYRDADGQKIKTGAALSIPYLAKNKPIVISQMQKAGLRLAAILNALAEDRPVSVFTLHAS
jgi:hypothetical protein